MKKFLVLSIALLFPLIAPPSFAIYDPLSVTNNKFGIHILYPEEVSEASSLVNSNGGDWGYVTIPIKSSDKDLVKWQTFMDNCKKYHIIPIIRLATEGDYFSKSSWSVPSDYDILDFANFLNSLSWPTKNRYVVVFNEVNRGDEWGGNPDPNSYAEILDYSTQAFKQINSNFFVIMAGLDNASANVPGQSIDEYTFMNEIEQADPGIFSKIDGIASHSYPNPGFSSSPNLNREGIYSFYYQKLLVNSFSGKDLPVFITETGWSSESVSQATQSQYYIQSFNDFWNDPSVVAVTPFVFNAAQGDFAKFSFLNGNQKNEIYQNYVNFKKTKGQPQLAGDFSSPSYKLIPMPTEEFKQTNINSVFKKVNSSSKEFFKWLLGV